ncbi:hypothetical protein MPC4_320020 [Methylocella tundrae]|uniref:Segregation and condensation protein B n=2 Tax=Methylocella tundrae TaxID=227605 RepID=A0A8B6M8Q6_METTU|nr:hypothetical protein MPC4_320020 [Methylocella tundrae]
MLMALAYFQPVVRGALSEFIGREVNRDLIVGLRAIGYIAAEPRSPRPGTPYAFVATKALLARFGLSSLHDHLPDIEMLEDAGLLAKDKLLAGEFPGGFAAAGDADEGDDRPDAAETASTGGTFDKCPDLMPEGHGLGFYNVEKKKTAPAITATDGID